MVKRIRRWAVAGQPRAAVGDALRGIKRSLTMWTPRNLTTFDMAKDRLEKSSTEL